MVPFPHRGERLISGLHDEQNRSPEEGEDESGNMMAMTQRKGPQRGDRDISRYSVLVAWSVEDGEYVATSPEWPDLSWLAASEPDAIRGLRGVMRDAVAVLTEEGSPIPAPRPQPSYSGQLRLRMPKSLHQAMVARADQEGVSLNTLALTYLSHGVGR
jgi:predicted HicB family RNase H-like nuclease